MDNEALETEQMFLEIFRSNWDVQPCEANRRLIIAYLQENLLPLTQSNASVAIDMLMGKGILAMRDPEDIEQEQSDIEAARAYAASRQVQPSTEPAPLDFKSMTKEQLAKYLRENSPIELARQKAIEKSRAKFRKGK